MSICDISGSARSDWERPPSFLRWAIWRVIRPRGMFHQGMLAMAGFAVVIAVLFGGLYFAGYGIGHMADHPDPVWTGRQFIGWGGLGLIALFCLGLMIRGAREGYRYDIAAGCGPRGPSFNPNRLFKPYRKADPGWDPNRR